MNDQVNTLVNELQLPRHLFFVKVWLRICFFYFVILDQWLFKVRHPVCFKRSCIAVLPARYSFRPLVTLVAVASKCVQVICFTMVGSSKSSAFTLLAHYFWFLSNVVLALTRPAYDLKFLSAFHRLRAKFGAGVVFTPTPADRLQRNQSEAFDQKLFIHVNDKFSSHFNNTVNVLV